MKTTIVVDRFPVISETFVARHARYLKATVFCVERDWSASMEEYRGDVQVVTPDLSIVQRRGMYIPGWYRARRFVNSVIAPSKNFTWNRYVEAAFRDYLEEARPDVVLAEFAPNALRVLPACSERQIPVVTHFHGYDASVLMRHEAYRRVVGSVFRISSAVVCVSSFMAENLLKAGCPRRKLHTIPCGAALEQFSPSDRVLTQPCRFVAVSRLEPVKGPFVALEAFRRVHASRRLVTLDWIGDGALRRDVEDFVDQHGLRDTIRLHGALAHSAIPAILARSSAFVQASLTAPNGAVEGWGLSIAEAMASCLPAVVSRSGGMVELVMDGHNGFTFAEGDPIEMSQKMAELADDPKLRLTMGLKGRRFVEQVGNASQNLSLLEAVLRETCDPAVSSPKFQTSERQCAE